ncbi:hypothetical protein KIPB_003396 [Kipferlia bialata]|uniref:Uncharacterized protein n=1 Tax=Kipferlia bialata TaxID=797122 RepID=A0A391NKM2_9EUKA|nr:hypothetical protein KIPB_003082 [Kipferlia bialata]GCA62415.1 hypothetical protein KIPB_003396 [Kipferlia bialata]|eukprot:g3082.t1
MSSPKQPLSPTECDSSEDSHAEDYLSAVSSGISTVEEYFQGIEDLAVTLSGLVTPTKLDPTALSQIEGVLTALTEMRAGGKETVRTVEQYITVSSRGTMDSNRRQRLDYLVQRLRAVSRKFSSSIDNAERVARGLVPRIQAVHNILLIPTLLLEALVSRPQRLCHWV